MDNVMGFHSVPSHITHCLGKWRVGCVLGFFFLSHIVVICHF